MKKAPEGQSRYFLPLGYLLLGVAWIVGSDYLLGVATEVPDAAHWIASTKGILFVLATAVLLFVVQSPRIRTLSSAHQPPQSGSGVLRPYLIFGITGVGVMLAGITLYQQQATEVRQRADATLVNTASVTARRLENWIDGLRTKLDFAGRDPLLAHALLNLRANDADTSRPDVKGGLEVLRQSEGFERVQVFSLAGEPIEHAGRAIALSDQLRFWMRGASGTGRVVMSDLYVPADSVDGKPVIDFVVTVMHGDRPNVVAGVLVARIDPDRRLFQMLAEAADSTRDISLTLARRESDAVAVLLPPTLRSGGADLYERRLVTPGTAAQQVASGQPGVISAPDEQGIAVLATSAAVAGTPWTLIATVPESVVFAAHRRIGRLGMLLAMAGVLVSGWLVAVWWRNERRAMAAQLDAAERRTTLVKEHFAIAGRFVHDIVLLLDSVDGTIVEANDRALDAYGYSRAELLARTIFELRPAGSEEQLRAKQRFENMRTTGGSSFVTRHWRKDGGSFPVEVSARYCELDGRRYLQMVGRDITERVESEARLAALSAERDRVLERLQRQFDQMATACIVLSAEGNVLQINPEHERVFGYSPQHLVGRNVREFVRKGDFVEKIYDWLERLRRDPEARLTEIFENVTLAGRLITCRWTGTALRDAEGRFGGLIGMAEDITEQVVAERALRQARDHLEERVAERTVELEQAKNAAEHADRVKSAFLSTMSHELRTPLNSILGFTDVLLQGLSGPLTEAQQRQLQIVRDSSTHLRALIEDVLDISRIEAGQVGLEFGEVDLADIVARRVEAIGPEYARKGLTLRIETEGAVPRIRSDRKRIAQIVNNLLSNALKFTEQGGVTFSIRAGLDRIELHVIDTGIGIPASALGTLFNPFTQVVRPGGRMHEGTGLGLAISRNLARALGGDITVVSEVGQGSRFEFWLPLVPREVDAASASATFRAADVQRALGAV